MLFPVSYTYRFNRIDQADTAILAKLDTLLSTMQGTTAALAELKTILAAQQKGFSDMSATVSQLDTEITALQTAVANETTVEQSAITLLNGIPALIAAAVAQAQAAGASPAQLQALTDLANTITANNSGLAAAVTANTPPPATP